jgi:Uma2 family endonuclease
MQEYIASGLKLGWLIDPQNNQVEIYRDKKNKETLQLPNQLSGEDVLPGFTLDLEEY